MRKILFAFSLLFVLLSFPLRTNPSLERDKNSTVVSWTDLTLTAEVNEKIPKINFEEESLEFYKKDTVSSQGQAYAVARKRAKEKLRLRLSQKIESIFFDANFTVFEYTEANLKARNLLNQFIGSEKEEFDYRIFKNVLEARMSIPIKGKEGMLAHLPRTYGTEKVPEFGEEVLPVEFSGLVVDARHLKLQRALFPKIQTDRGLDIYSPMLVKEPYAVETGYAVYRKESKGINIEARVGKNPFYVVALSVGGKNQTDLILPTEEAAKLTAHPESRKNLTRCKVLILTEN